MNLREIIENPQPPPGSVWEVVKPSPSGSIDVEQRGLTTFQGAPRVVEGELIVNGNNLTSFEGAPEYIGDSLTAWRNKFTSLRNIHKYIKYIGGDIILFENPIQSHILGVLLIKGWRNFYLDTKDGINPTGPIDRIINTYKHDINLCQDALIDAGYPNLAKL